jgi:hypothetical protein
MLALLITALQGELFHRRKFPDLINAKILAGPTLRSGPPFNGLKKQVQDQRLAH